MNQRLYWQKRDELRINLIHFDKNMTNGENYGYFNKFKVDVVGGFYAMDDVNIFKKFLCRSRFEKRPLRIRGGMLVAFPPY